MSDYEMVKQLYEWGIDIKPYVGLMISEDEYEEIIKKGE